MLLFFELAALLGMGEHGNCASGLMSPGRHDVYDGRWHFLEGRTWPSALFPHDEINFARVNKQFA